EGNAWQGISVAFGDVTVQSNVFRNNACQPTYAGMVLVGNFGAGPSSAQIVNNVIENNTSCPAVNVMDGGTAKVINNTLVRNQAGIRIDNQSGATGHLYQNNTIVQNGTGL